MKTVKTIKIDSPNCSIFSDGYRYSSGRDTISRWDLSKTQKIEIILEYHNRICCLAVSKKYLYYGRVSYNDIKQLNLTTGKITTLAESLDDIYCLIISEDLNNKSYLYSGSKNGSIIKWDTAESQKMASLLGHQGSISQLCTSSSEENNYLYSASHDHTIKTWDLETNQLIQSINYDDYNARFVVLNNFLYFGMYNGIVKKIDLDKPLESNYDGELLYPASEYIFSLYVSKDTKYLYAGYGNGVIRKWDLNKNLEQPRIIDVIHGHTRCVRCLSISKGYLYSDGDDGTIRKWSDNENSLTVELHLFDEYAEYYANGLIDAALRCFLAEETRGLIYSLL